MTRRVKVWFVLAVLFTLVNLAGGVYAAVHREVLHACVHAVLALLGQYVAWRLATRRAATGWGAGSSEYRVTGNE